MERRPIIAANWKMNKTTGEAHAFVQDFLSAIQGFEQELDVVICPPFTALVEATRLLEGSPVFLGAQNVFWEESGAFTGEVSPGMLKDLGVQYVVIGHSERRAIFGETDEMVNRKTRAALAAGLHPIICVGESLEQRQAGQTDGLVSRQVNRALATLGAGDVEDVVIAYEPIWAIGTGETATAEEANRVIGIIRQAVADSVGEERAQAMRIQYGGSVKPGNAVELMQQSEIDGALVGGASLKVETFVPIVEAGLHKSRE